MTKLRFLMSLFLVVAFFAHCSATASKRSFGETVDDQVIAVKLRSKFVKDKGVKSRNIKLKVWKGVVTLNGNLERQSQINRAIELAEQQRGVKEVKAYLVLKEVTAQNSNKSKWYWPFGKKDNMQKIDDGEQSDDIHETDLTNNQVNQVGTKLNQKPKTNDDTDSQVVTNSPDYQEVEF